MNTYKGATAQEILNSLCPMLTQFAAVAREGQITKAANALKVPQPTVTRHLASLESILGVRLGKRTREGISLTDEGEKLIEPIQEATTILANAIDRLTSHSVVQATSFGFLHTLGEEVVPGLLREFADCHENYRFSLMESSADQLLGSLADGDVELCITAPLPESSLFSVRSLGLQQIVLAVPEHHELSGEKNVPLSAVASDEFVTFEWGNHMRRISDSLCYEAGFEPRIAFEAGEIGTLRGLVAAGLGVALVPAAPSPIRGLVEIVLADPAAVREIGLVWLAHGELRPQTKKFREFIIERFRSPNRPDLNSAQISNQSTRITGGANE